LVGSHHSSRSAPHRRQSRGVGLGEHQSGPEELGARPNLPFEVTRRIVEERKQGKTFQAIADGLMDDGIPTSRGRRTWFPATIKAVVESNYAASLSK
jgi:hypothetical protein